MYIRRRVSSPFYISHETSAVVMRAVMVENPGYFCNMIRCRPSWIWPKVDLQNCSAYVVSYCTCLPNVNTVGKCTAELL